MSETAKTTCRTPNATGTTNIPTWKFEAVRAAILEACSGDGIAFKDLPAAVGERLSEPDREALGSLGWHTTTVKLELEVAGEIARVAGRSPQWLVRV